MSFEATQHQRSNPILAEPLDSRHAAIPIQQAVGAGLQAACRRTAAGAGYGRSIQHAERASLSSFKPAIPGLSKDDTAAPQQNAATSFLSCAGLGLG
jgi:hypothetical protein